MAHRELLVNTNKTKIIGFRKSGNSCYKSAPLFFGENQLENAVASPGELSGISIIRRLVPTLTFEIITNALEDFVVSTNVTTNKTTRGVYRTSIRLH